MEIFGILWQEIIMRPMINSLALLYQLLFSNFGFSIIVFTILIRLAMIPLTVRQTRQMKKMQIIQPKMKAIQDKYKGKSGDARRQMSSETMALYKEAGVKTHSIIQDEKLFTGVAGIMIDENGNNAINIVSGAAEYLINSDIDNHIENNKNSEIFLTRASEKT